MAKLCRVLNDSTTMLMTAASAAATGADEQGGHQHQQRQWNWTMMAATENNSTAHSHHQQSRISPASSAVLYFQEDCMEVVSKTYYQLLSPFKPSAAAFFSLMYAAISVFGLLGNGLVILAVIRNPRMRTSRNMFIVNLALNNFLLAGMLYPFLWIPSEAYLFPYGKAMCRMVNALPAVNVYCSTLTITAMSADRYYSAQDTRGHNAVTIRARNLSAVLVALGTWLISIALSAPLLVFFDTVMFPPSWVDIPVSHNRTRTFAWPLCVLAPNAGKRELLTITMLMSFVQILFIYIIPLGVLIFFNYRLIQFIWSNTIERVVTRMNENGGGIMNPSHHNHQNLRNQPSLTSNNNNNNAESVHPSSINRYHSRRHHSRRRNRTAVLLIAMAGSYAALWFPYTLNTLLNDLLIVSHKPVLDNLFKLISMLSICVNPVLYGYLNTNFRREFYATFSWIQCCRLRAAHLTDDLSRKLKGGGRLSGTGNGGHMNGGWDSITAGNNNNNTVSGSTLTTGNRTNRTTLTTSGDGNFQHHGLLSSRVSIVGGGNGGHGGRDHSHQQRGISTIETTSNCELSTTNCGGGGGPGCCCLEVWGQKCGEDSRVDSGGGSMARRWIRQIWNGNEGRRQQFFADRRKRRACINCGSKPFNGHIPASARMAADDKEMACDTQSNGVRMRQKQSLVLSISQPPLPFHQTASNDGSAGESKCVRDGAISTAEIDEKLLAPEFSVDGSIMNPNKSPTTTKMDQNGGCSFTGNSRSANESLRSAVIPFVDDDSSQNSSLILSDSLKSVHFPSKAEVSDQDHESKQWKNIPVETNF